MSLTANWLCYRLYTWEVDAELSNTMWKSVTHAGGWVTVRNDCIDFFVEREHSTEFILRWGDYVTRRRDLDHF